MKKYLNFDSLDSNVAILVKSTQCETLLAPIIFKDSKGVLKPKRKKLLECLGQFLQKLSNWEKTLTDVRLLHVEDWGPLDDVSNQIS